MTLISSFIRLKSANQKLVLKTFFLSYYIRLITWILPFPRVRRISRELGNESEKDRLDAHRLIWSVQVTSPYVYRSTCLTKALTTQILLDRHHYPSTLRIGVVKEEEFEAHAWLEMGDEVVLGESEREYVPLMDLE
jgi:hypothetical protein